MRQALDKERIGTIRGMFSRIAAKYDLANRWMTWGQDVKWRQEVLKKAQLPAGGRVLDIGTGTGDLARQAIQLDKSLFIVGADLTLQMMHVGRQQSTGECVVWLCTDILDLPFQAGSFDVVISGYLVRNVIDIQRALAEQYRVLKWGGRMVCLDTTPPPADFFHLPVRLYLRLLIPLIGGGITGNRKAYTYLSDSTQTFLQAEELENCLTNAGFGEVGFRRFMGGVIAIHWGTKQPKSSD